MFNNTIVGYIANDNIYCEECFNNANTCGDYWYDDKIYAGEHSEHGLECCVCDCEIEVHVIDNEYVREDYY